MVYTSFYRKMMAKKIHSPKEGIPPFGERYYRLLTISR